MDSPLSDRLIRARHTLAAAASRPWFVVPPPWNEGAPWVNSGSEDPHGGEFVADFTWPHDMDEIVERTEANAGVACDAVNAFAILLDLAEASERLSIELAHYLGVTELDEDSALVVRLRARAVEWSVALERVRRGL